MLSLNPEPKYFIPLERVNNRKELDCVFHQKQGSWHWHAERCETTGKQGQNATSGARQLKGHEHEAQRVITIGTADGRMNMLSS